MFGVAALCLGLANLGLAEETVVSVSFGKGAWDPAAWVLARNPTVENLGQWVQRDTCIENATPTDPARMSSLEDTLTTMVYREPVAGDWTATATLQFGPGGAPGIVLAQDWAPGADGRPVYGEFYEAIIYARGINLWRHFAREGRRVYERTVFFEFELQPDTPYRFSVQRKGAALEMSIDGRRAGVLLPALPEQLFLGVEGCEGVCQVTDFVVTR